MIHFLLTRLSGRGHRRVRRSPFAPRCSRLATCAARAGGKPPGRTRSASLMCTRVASEWKCSSSEEARRDCAMGSEKGGKVSSSPIALLLRRFLGA